MSVGGSGEIDDVFANPPPGKGQKSSASNKAKQDRDSAVFRNVSDIPIDASSAQKKRDADYIASRQAQHIQHFEGREAAREFRARYRKVGESAIEAAREFALPQKPEKISRDELHRLNAEAAHIKATKGRLAHSEFVAEKIHGISREAIIGAREFASPEQDANQNLRNNLFGGFSAFGLVQSSLASFANSLSLANQSLTNFVESAIIAGSPNVNLMTDPAKALLASAPGIGAGLGALLSGNPIVGGAIGFLGGSVGSAVLGSLLNSFTSLDSSISQLTSSLVGFSPTLSVQSALQDARRIQRQFERAQLLESPLASVSEARFRLEEALANVGDRLVLRFAPLLEQILNMLTIIVDFIEILPLPFG